MNKRALAVLAAILVSPPYAAAQDPTPSSTPLAPNTDHCPYSLLPPEPETTSENLKPGAASPTPLPPTSSSHCGISAPKGFKVDERVLASAWMVTDLDTQEVIAYKDPHGRYRPASIIKALLALVAIRDLDPQAKVVATQEDAEIEGSAVGLGSGGTYTVEQLLEGLILASGNDAAHALAQALGGDAKTLREINKLARDLGTTDTYAASYSGLDSPGMSTSVFDMSLIYQAAFANPRFAAIAGTEHVDFPGYDGRPGYEVWNDNGLFINDPDGIGGKTGYTDDAHHTFAGALDRNGRRLLVVILDTKIDSGLRAWQQGQLLLHEAYQVPPGHGLGKLEALGATATAEPSTGAVASDTRTASPGDSTTVRPKTTATAAPGAKSTAAHGAERPWLGWLVCALVAALVLLVATVSLRLPRQQSGRGNRGARSQRP